MDGARCIITGCALYLGEDLGHWGDLHEAGDLYIFNAALNLAKTEPVYVTEDWSEVKSFQIADKPSTLLVSCRGVFVFHKSDTTFNQLAQAHLDKWGK